MSTIFSLAYLAPIQYYYLFLNEDKSTIEQYCNYTKQTYRNRTTILAANGPLALMLPISKGSDHKTITKDIKLSYDTRWQDLHWRSITSAYNSSPYFEYYQDDFRQFYEKQYSFLLDFNIDLMKLTLELLDINSPIKLSNEYSKNYTKDYRQIIHPKINYQDATPKFKSINYRQVFENKFGFTPNLSIIDLLFNKGPESIFYLNEKLINKQL